MVSKDRIGKKKYLNKIIFVNFKLLANTLLKADLMLEVIYSSQLLCDAEESMGGVLLMQIRLPYS